ncbi:MAG: class A beta-lactamase-related serine hydrolase [Thermomicrobiales bacterium]|nr:class A beta-lactamase-related serine hydrolase [Thermomicrobiales bacterium]
MKSARSRTRTFAGLLIVILIISLLAACGGSDSQDSTAPGSVTTSAPTAVATLPLSVATTDPEPTATEETADEPEESEDTEEPAAPPLDPSALQGEIDALIADVDGLTAIEIEDPDGTTLATSNAYEQLEAASLYKLAIMVETYRQRQMGMLTFDDAVVLEPYHFSQGEDVYTEDEIGYTVDVGSLLESMITLSSNVAATALLEYVGTDNINETLASLGLTSTEIRWYPGPGGSIENDSGRALLGVSDGRMLADLRADQAFNVTSAADVAALMRMLLAGEVVDAESSQEMIDLLARQQINDRLPAYLPEGTEVAHKTGNLDGLMHDAGIIFAPAGPVIVVVMTEDVDEWVSTDLIAQIGLLAYQTHE